MNFSKKTLFFSLFFFLTALSSLHAEKQKATLGGGCFWCMEPPFANVKGVLSKKVGYMGGKTKNPTYEEVSSGNTGHVEVIQLEFNDKEISYEKILEIFFQSIDPTQVGGQFADYGSQYETVIFTHSAKQKQIAQKFIQSFGEQKHFEKPIVVQIKEAKEFYPAEEYHQEFYKKNEAHYKSYSEGSGRKGFLEKKWGKYKR